MSISGYRTNALDLADVGECSFDPDQSPTISPTPLELQYTYPSTTLTFGSSLLNVSGQLVPDTVVDPRDDTDKRTIFLVDRFLDGSGSRITGEYGVETGFNPDTEGFYGLGVDLVRRHDILGSAYDQASADIIILSFTGQPGELAHPASIEFVKPTTGRLDSRDRFEPIFVGHYRTRGGIALGCGTRGQLSRRMASPIDGSRGRVKELKTRV